MSSPHIVSRNVTARAASLNEHNGGIAKPGTTAGLGREDPLHRRDRPGENSSRSTCVWTVVAPLSGN
jgi:hypothetical protein